ncbi:hypothetical protein LAG90_09045 [Marinilongibacter aquaticus]|uniref:hypothetical protein n=1 Tax=Marinilongibacter aquaticus TaxID=2975157 RepID=UPI0021BD6350|nr:hypothetical protein [Marinilongibacter aquaticus]UBM60780.1 hypothetical protein LAG90_09045 [Marinilongibacter aquaticus]
MDYRIQVKMKTALADTLAQLKNTIQRLNDLVESGLGQADIEALKEIPILVKALDKIDDPYQARAKYRKGFLKDWLAQKGFYTARAAETLKVDEKLLKAADYLAHNYFKLDNFFTELKWKQNIRRNFNFSDDSTAMPVILEWATMLQDSELIEMLINKQTSLYIDIAELAKATSFINGYWLEILLRSRISDWLRQNIDEVGSYDILSQVHVSKSDGKVSELDLLFMLNGKVFWFECKSGEIGKYYALFASHRQMLGLKFSQAIAVVIEPNAQIASNFRTRSGMQTFFSTDLKEQIEALLKLKTE